MADFEKPPQEGDRVRYGEREGMVRHVSTVFVWITWDDMHPYDSDAYALTFFAEHMQVMP